MVRWWCSHGVLMMVYYWVQAIYWRVGCAGLLGMPWVGGGWGSEVGGGGGAVRWVGGGWGSEVGGAITSITYPNCSRLIQASHLRIS